MFSFSQSSAFVSFDEIYESIRSIEILINQNNKQVGRLVDQITFLKIDNNRLIRDLNLIKLKVKIDQNRFKLVNNLIGNQDKPVEDVKKEELNRDQSGFLEDSLETSRINRYNKGDDTDLDRRISRLHLKGTNGERDTQFFSQVYELLRKRKQIPVQEINLKKLDVYDERFDQTDEPAAPTNMVTAPVGVSPHVNLESSFLKLNSPNTTVIQAPVLSQTEQAPKPAPIVKPVEAPTSSTPQKPMFTNLLPQTPQGLKPTFNLPSQQVCQNR